MERQTKLMLPVGKLPPDILDSLLKRCAIKDDRIKVGPALLDTLAPLVGVLLRDREAA